MFRNVPEYNTSGPVARLMSCLDVDLYPAVYTKHGGNYRTKTWDGHRRKPEVRKMEEGSSSTRSYLHSDGNHVPSNF